MDDIKMNYKTQESKLEMVEYIRDFINENDEVIIVNIGTDRCLGDSLSPMIGTLLHENDCPLKVYGDMDFPIHALNLENRLIEIKKNHPNAKIIGIDACLGDYSDIGEIQIRDRALYPGKGVGKSLPKVGNICIIGIVDSSEDAELFTNRNIRLSLIYNMARTIADVILTACDSSTKDIKFYNRDKNTYKEPNTDVIKEIAIN